MLSRLVDNWKIAAPIGIVGLGVFAFLAFGVFGVHTLFVDDVVDEDGPAFASGAVSQDVLDEIDEVMENEDIPADVTASEADPMPGDIVTQFTGSFFSLAHPQEGTAVVLNDGTAQRFLRFEDDFAGDNGPDLDVYLTRVEGGTEVGGNGDYIDLGDLKGNIGAQNYEIPEDVDLEEFDTVVIWCVRFGVSFGAAELTPT